MEVAARVSLGEWLEGGEARRDAEVPTPME